MCFDVQLHFWLKVQFHLQETNYIFKARDSFYVLGACNKEQIEMSYSDFFIQNRVCCLTHKTLYIEHM